MALCSSLGLDEPHDACAPHRTPRPWGRSSEPPPRPLLRLLCAPSMVRELASLPEGLSFLPPLRTPPGGDNLEPVGNGHWTGPAHEEGGGPSWKVWAGEREGSGGDTPPLGTLPRCPPARHSVAAAALAEGAGARSLGRAGAGQDSLLLAQAPPFLWEGAGLALVQVEPLLHP